MYIQIFQFTMQLREALDKYSCTSWELNWKGLHYKIFIWFRWGSTALIIILKFKALQQQNCIYSTHRGTIIFKQIFSCILWSYKPKNFKIINYTNFKKSYNIIFIIFSKIKPKRNLQPYKLESVQRIKCFHCPRILYRLWQ